ncbi:MAG: beta-lactamase family protein [Bacilli bacterium]|nr:beta-lactamase family protein [Bacilli bacterium]
MNEDEYLRLIQETCEEVINEFKSSHDKEELSKIFQEIARKLLETKDDGYDVILKAVIQEYLDSVEAIAKLSPGLSTGLYDELEGITINTYNGKMSDISNDVEVSEKTVFDASSMTKMFTAILLLKEAEKGNIDLTKPFSHYSPLLSKVNVPIIDALRFGVNLRTDGRLDDSDISEDERKRRLLNTSVQETNTFIYSDIPYMLVPLLFGKTMEEATENYLEEFYKLYRDELGLSKTGYSTIDMTGGTIKTELENERFPYIKTGVYDPKANIFEQNVGYVSGHAGATTTVMDLEKLFFALSHGFLSEKSLKDLITTVQPESHVLLDKEGNTVIRNNRPVIINHAMGVYINVGSIRISDIPEKYSDTTFAAEGSTGTYSIFDLENGLNATYLSNVRSGLYHKWINTDGYAYGDNDDEMPRHYQTTLVSGTGTIRDGRMIKPDGTFMTYSRATNNFKEEELMTLLKLRIAKRVLVKKAKLEYSGDELEVELRRIHESFNFSTNHREAKESKSI